MDWNKLLSNQRIRKSKPNDIRNQFESDYGRIIYSNALRRMHDKTQVFPLTTDDNIHSRLTHTNEVMSLGYTFGLKLSQSKLIQARTGKNELELLRILPILMQNACLIHDIGNAPFGHFGETIVSDYFKELNHKNFQGLDERKKRDFFNYDGNAQGLRVLTKLQYLDNPFGLNLTYATLATFLKYPNSDEINDVEKDRLANKGECLRDEFIEKSKHGVFFSEEDYFKKIITECGLTHNNRIIRHPLCYLMEAADSIAYLCMDMEDGYHKGLVTILHIKEIFSKNKSTVSKAIVEICEDNTLHPTTQMVEIRIKLIGYFVKLAFDNFEDNLEKIETGNYNQELIKNDVDKVHKIVATCCFSRIFLSRGINYLESTGHAVFKGLLDFYINFLFNDNNNYVRRGKILVSKSIIEAAIDETLLELCERKLNSESKRIEGKIIIFKSNLAESERLKEDQLKLESKQLAFTNLKNEYSKLFDQQLKEELSKEDQKQLRIIKKSIYELIKPEFEDLDDYFKFRVILDFISGMTDQFALNHYQKLSGQKII